MSRRRCSVRAFPGFCPVPRFLETPGRIPPVKLSYRMAQWGTAMLVAAPWSVVRGQVSPQGAAPAARRELVGIVRDTAGHAIEGASVEIPSAFTRTNARGAFQLWTPAIDTMTLSVRRLGFEPMAAFL